MMIRKKKKKTLSWSAAINVKQTALKSVVIYLGPFELLEDVDCGLILILDDLKDDNFKPDDSSHEDDDAKKVNNLEIDGISYWF